MNRYLFILSLLIFYGETLSAQVCSGSLGSPVVNIDFGSGTGRGAALGSSFTSYTYSASGFPNDGYYTIANSTAGLLNSWWSTYDHDYQTTGSTTGYMMIVNASLSVTDYFFKDTVKGLCAGTSYEFAAWVMNLFNNGNTVYPDLTFNIYDAASGSLLGTYNTGNIVGSTSAVSWKQYGLCFTSATNSVVLKITNNKAGAAPGNDLVLDDITFRPYGGMITATTSDGSVSKDICPATAGSLQLVSSFASATANTQYQWQVSKDGGTTWSDISGATSSTYITKDITAAGTYIYRIATAEGSNINSASCRILSDIITVTVKAFTAAALLPSYINCDNYTFNFENNDSSSAVAAYLWSFGDGNNSTTASPTHTYSGAGSYALTLKVTNANGCSDSASSIVKVYPGFTPAFSVSGSCYLSPFQFTDKSTVQVNVLPFITVKFNSDTAICKTDVITLNPVSYALSYFWTQSPAGNSLNNYHIKTPLASPDTTTTYYVRANLGHCQDSAHITVYVSPYPTATAGADTSVCYGTTAQLSGATDAQYFEWSPTTSLNNSNTLTPTATPLNTTTYYLAVHGTQYCPKYVSDSVTVNVIPKLIIDAGSDTTVVINEPLQFNATGGNTATDTYLWNPSAELTNSSIYNPVATYTTNDPDSVLYTVTVTTPQGCTGSGNILVKIMKIKPDILVPSGFTPNGDGLNDILKPLPFGIKEFKYFSVYNRFGQLIFKTSQPDSGWDGTLKGVPQDTGIFVYITEGIDYAGNIIFRKGTTTLIR